MVDFVLVKPDKSQSLAVWTHVSEIFGSLPTSGDDDVSALSELKQDFPVQWSIISNKNGTRIVARSLVSLLRQYNKGNSKPIQSASELLQYLQRKKTEPKTNKVLWHNMILGCM